MTRDFRILIHLRMNEICFFFSSALRWAKYCRLGSLLFEIFFVCLSSMLDLKTPPRETFMTLSSLNMLSRFLSLLACDNIRHCSASMSRSSSMKDIVCESLRTFIGVNYDVPSIWFCCEPFSISYDSSDRRAVCSLWDYPGMSLYSGFFSVIVEYGSFTYACQLRNQGYRGVSSGRNALIEAQCLYLQCWERLSLRIFKPQ